MSRIHDMPVYASREDKVEASLYNLWRRARLHLPMPLRIELPSAKQMAIIVEQDHWVVVDQNQYDLPILAWVDFQDEGRSSLHTPVECTLNYYHYMASRIRLTALQELAKELENKLNE